MYGEDFFFLVRFKDGPGQGPKSLSTAADVGERMNTSSAKDAQVGKCATTDRASVQRLGLPTTTTEQHSC